MKIGFVINAIATEKPEYTTVRLALAAAARGSRDVADGRRRLLPPRRRHRRRACSHGQREPGDGPSRRSSRASRTTSTAARRSAIDDLDVLVMRNDPADDMPERPWAVTSGVLFAQLSVAAGTLVVNDPASLANAVNKTYFQHFPESGAPAHADLPRPGRHRRVRRGDGRRPCSSRCRARVAPASSSCPTTSRPTSTR